MNRQYSYSDMHFEIMKAAHVLNALGVPYYAVSNALAGEFLTEDELDAIYDRRPCINTIPHSNFTFNIYINTPD